MVQISNTLTASVQPLTLGKGLHLFSITAATPQRVGDGGEMMLPAIHVGVGPGASTDGVEILPGPRNNGHWLFEAGDTLVVRITTPQAVLMLTTVRTGTLPAISVEITRLDRKAPAATPPPAQVAPAQLIAIPISGPTAQSRAALVASPVTAPPALRNAQGATALSTRIDLHIENRGDTSYVNNFWAGALGDRLAIEAFSVSPLEGLRPDQIEYAGVMASGAETGWIEGGRSCGVKGAAIALAGFAVRIKTADQDAYECEYRGSFRSGRIVGPMHNGAPCHSDPGDFLEAIQLFILPRSTGQQATPVVAPAADPAPPPGEPPHTRPIGPRFSVFRETRE